MAFSSPSLQPNPNPPLRHPLLLHKTQIHLPFNLQFRATRVQSLPSTSERSNTKRRKRKPRPSFLEETMERWSVKTPSQRDTFPWENNKNSDEKKPEFEFDEGGRVNVRLNSIVERLNVDLESAKLDVLNDGVEDLRHEDSGLRKKSDCLKENFEFDRKDEVREGGLVEEEMSKRPNLKGAKLEKKFDISEEISERPNFNAKLKNNFDPSEEISERPNFNGAKLKKNFDPFSEEISERPSFKGANLKKNIDPFLEEISERPNFKAAKLKNNLDHNERPRVDFYMNNPNFENNSNSVSDFKHTRIRSSPRQTHKSKLNTTIDKSPTTPKFQKPSNPKPKTLDTSIAKLMADSVTLPWERANEEDEFQPLKTNTELAERTIPETELKRLRDAALRMKERLKVGPAGVTGSLCEIISEKWKQEEVVKLRFEGPPSFDMKRIHEILEEKTGGIVIWRSGKSVVLFRGMTYTLPCARSYSNSELSKNRETENRETKSPIPNQSTSSEDTFNTEALLDGLGPRYRDWSGRGPVPVDADLLPGFVPGYHPPYRTLPFRTRRTLRDHEMTALRRLARNMPPHFALGRNREHQGLASAIVKLWEKSVVAKIAIKRGVYNTSNERMAEEIKKLTGGTILSRNKEYIVLYRGNDFMTPSIRDILLEKQKEAVLKLDEEESARLKALDSSSPNYLKVCNGRHVAGTLQETIEAKSKWSNQLSEEEREEIRRDLKLSKHASLVRFLERKLFFANVKIEKAEKALAKVQEKIIPAELPSDLETVTDEERSKFRTIGLKMKAFGFLGIRGVFSGTVQNMHLNWKNKELVKVIVKRKSFAQVKHIAIALEAESGGVLISVDKTSKGYAIVLYRGKNYQRPHVLRPKNLLTKRQALARSIELQRREALLHHLADLQEKIETLKSQLEEMKADKASKNGELILQENDTCSDDEFEEEGDEAYLRTYASGDDNDDNDDDD